MAVAPSAPPPPGPAGVGVSPYGDQKLFRLSGKTDASPGGTRDPARSGSKGLPPPLFHTRRPVPVKAAAYPPLLVGYWELGPDLGFSPFMTEAGAHYHGM